VVESKSKPGGQIRRSTNRDVKFSVLKLVLSGDRRELFIYQRLLNSRI
jgi:hypothetical protein